MYRYTVKDEAYLIIRILVCFILRYILHFLTNMKKIVLFPHITKIILLSLLLIEDTKWTFFFFLGFL